MTISPPPPHAIDAVPLLVDKYPPLSPIIEHYIRHGWPRSLHAIIDRHDVDDVDDDVDVYPIRRET